VELFKAGGKIFPALSSFSSITSVAANKWIKLEEKAEEK
jgi:hypothetical protein